MSRIAYLIGESGAGKSHLAQQISADCDIKAVFGDHVLSRTAQRVTPIASPGKEMDTGGWLERAKHSDLQAGFRTVISECYTTFVVARQNILAEATLFCLRDLLESFHGAVLELRPDLVDARIFYLNASPEMLVANIARRPRKEHKITLEVAKMRIKFLESKLAQHGQVWTGEVDPILWTTGGIS